MFHGDTVCFHLSKTLRAVKSIERESRMSRTAVSRDWGGETLLVANGHRFSLGDEQGYGDGWW